MDSTISSVISISPAFATEVHLKRDFTNSEANREKLRGYVPTSSSRKALRGILEGLHPASRKRVHLTTGSYGTGKSHFGLVLANLVSKDLQDPDLGPFLEKLGDKDPSSLQYVQTMRKATKPFLVVLPELYYDPEGLYHSLTIALDKALEREGIQFRPPSHFAAALDCIQKWQQNVPEAYEKLKAAFLKREKTVEMVMDGLKDHSDTMYALFKVAHRDVAYDAVFHPQITEPTSVYEETAKHLKSTGAWQGIFIFYDEFGNYLTQMARDPDSRGGQQLQEFAEFCKRSGENQCHLMVIAHQTLQDYARGYRTQEEWAKISGRFIDSEYTLAMAGDEPETEDMIDSIIIQKKGELWRDVSGHGDFDILADLARDTGLYPKRNMSWIESSLVRGCYPMHPFAVFCLPWISDRVGQRERTVFTFLSRSSEESLRHFIDTNSIERSDGRLNLYTVDMLFDYFNEQIRAHADYRHIVLAADNALAVCGESALGTRIIKTISVLLVVEHHSLGPTKRIIAEALHLSPGQQQEVDAILTELVNQRVLWYHRAADRYELPGKTGGVVDAREAVDKEKKSLLQKGGLDLVGFLNSSYRPQPIIAYEYAQNHFVRRQAACEYITASHLSNPVMFLNRIERWYKPRRGRYEGDILVLYIVADATADIEGAQNYLGKEACKHSQLVIAVPKKPITFTETALELQAIALLRQAGLTLEEGTIDSEDLRMIEQDAVNGIQDGLAEFKRADNLTWYCDGNVVANLQRGGEERFISTVLEHVFSKAPLIRDEATANPIFTTDKDKKGRQNAMDRILGVKGAFQVQKAGGPAADRILRFCLKDTELLEKVADKASVGEFEVRDVAPPNSELTDVWKFMNEKVVTKGGNVTEMAEIVEPLLSPPYGLSNQSVEILLAAFLRNRRDDSTVFSNVQNYKRTGNQDAFTLVHLDGQTVTRMVSEPEDHAIVYYEIKPEERQYLQKLANILGADESLLSTQGLWEGTKSALLDWYEALPLLTKSTQGFQNPLCIPMLEVLGNTDKKRQPKELLQNYLPQAFGLDMAQSGQVLERFKEVCEELNGYVRSKEASLLAELGTVFNASGSTEVDVAEALRGWYNKMLTETQRLHSFGGDEGCLLQAVRQEGSIVESMLRTLPSGVGLGPYTEWESDDTKDLFILRIKLAKQNIEAWVPPTGKETPEGDLEMRTSRAERQIRSLFDELGIPPPARKEILERLLKELTP